MLLILFVGIISISLSAIFIRLCFPMPPVSIAVFRLGIASFILFLIALFKGCKVRFRRREMFLMSMGGFFLALHLITWIASLDYTSVANSVALVTTNPVFVGIFSVLFSKRRMEKEIIIGIILSVLGSFLVSRGYAGEAYHTSHLLGDVLALMGAMFASGYIIVGGIVREKVDTFEYILFTYSVTFVILFIVSFPLGFTFYRGKPLFFGFPFRSYVFVFLLAIVSQLIGHTSFNYSLKFLKPDFVAITILGEPVGASLFAYCLFGERISFIQLLGMVLIFFAVIVASKKASLNEVID